MYHTSYRTLHKFSLKSYTLKVCSCKNGFTAGISISIPKTRNQNAHVSKHGAFKCKFVMLWKQITSIHSLRVPNKEKDLNYLTNDLLEDDPVNASPGVHWILCSLHISSISFSFASPVARPVVNFSIICNR